MEDSGAPSHAALFDQILAAEQPHSPFHHCTTFSDPSNPLFDIFEDLFTFDINHFDFELLEPPPQQPTAPIVPVDSETSEEPNAQASMPAPVEPTVGLDSGKSVVPGDLCMAGGGDDVGAEGCGEKKAKRLQRRGVAVDSSLTALMEAAPTITVGKRAMDSEQLAELARTDPKKAKRILANRESAAKSKEKKRQYETEMLKKVQLLQIKVNEKFNNINKYQRRSAEGTVHIKEMRIGIDAMREQDRIKDALSGVSKEEVQGSKKEIENLNV